MKVLHQKERLKRLKKLASILETPYSMTPQPAKTFKDISSAHIPFFSR
jgi:hypothetical protein